MTRDKYVEILQIECLYFGVQELKILRSLLTPVFGERNFVPYCTSNVCLKIRYGLCTRTTFTSCFD